MFYMEWPLEMRANIKETKPKTWQVLHFKSFSNYFIFVYMLNPANKRIALIPLYLLVLGVVLLPFVFSTSTLDYTLAPRFTYMGVLLMLLAASQIVTKSPSLSIFRFTWPFWVFIALEGLSILNANTPSEGLVVILRDVGLLLLMILVVKICQREGSVRIVSKGWVIANAIIGSYGLYQFFSVGGLMDESRLYEVISFLGHRNLFASALVITLPFLVFTAWQSRGIWRWLSLVLLAHSSFLIFVLESRTAWLAYIVFIVSYPAWIVLERIIGRFQSRFLIKAFIAILIVGISAFSWVYFSGENLDRRGQELQSGVGFTSTNDKTFTIDERVMLWKGTLRMTWSEDFVGVGAGNWKIMFPAYGSDIWRARQGMVQFQRPHNDYLWVLSETGIFGLATYILGFVVILIYGLKAAANDRFDQSDRVLIRLLLSGVLAYLLVAFFSFPRERIFHQVVLHTTLGIVICLSRPSISTRTFSAVFINILSIIVGVLITWVGLNWWQGEVVTRKVNEARARGDWKGLIEEYDKVEHNRVYKIDAVSVPLSFYSGLAYLNLEEYPKSEQEFSKAYKLHPNNIHVINNMANICFLQGKTDSAIVFYRKALEVSPKYLDGALNLMAAYFNSHQIDEAYAVLRRYEDIFSQEEPGHPTLAMYRMAILNAEKTRMIEREENESMRNYLESLDERQLEKLHFESLQQGVTLGEILEKY